ncbi:MAG: tetratricopeptide repeat protein [Gemmataceae bacterium]
MSKKHKHHAWVPSGHDLAARVERTRREGRFQQALDLAKQLHRDEPTVEHLDLLKDTYLKRAEQLSAQGHPRDAATTLEAASRLDEKNLSWLGKLIEPMGRTGEIAKTLELLARMKQLGGGDDSAVLGALADASIVNEKASRDLLPAAMQADRDRVLLAFQQVEAGRDEAAREALQPVGLRSPFLEWKVLLRGLQAYCHHDDTRALENWQRLDPRRVPARLAAPYRAAIDPAFRALSRPRPSRCSASDSNGSPATWCRRTSAPCAGAGEPRHARPGVPGRRALLPTLRQQAPHLIDRLARLLYAAILRYGPDEPPLPAGVRRPADDPNFHRLEAVALDTGGDWAEAHKKWQAFEKEVAACPDRWPGEQGTVARALIWQRMGDNAALIPTKEQRKKLPRFLRDLDAMPGPLKPSAEECYSRSLELAPDLLDAHEGMIDCLMKAEKFRPAIEAAERLLARFPDHVETLQKLATLHLIQQDYPAALAAMERALRHNPLDRAIRERVGKLHLLEARELATEGKCDQARPHYQAALDYSDADRHPGIRCRWAACEIKAGDQARADELLDQARAKMPGELLVTFHLLIDSIRLKLGNPLKTKLTKAFNAEIEGPPTAALALGLVELAAEYAAGPTEYYGRQTHAKKVVAYAGRVPPNDFSEAKLERVLAGLTTLDASSRLMNRLFEFAQTKFPDNPRFHYQHAVFLMGDRLEEMAPHWRISQLLMDAEKLAARRPAGEPGLKEMLDDVKRRRAMIQAFNPFLGRLEELFGGMGAFGFDEDEEFED